MAITRREFISRSALAAAGAAFGPALFRHPLVRQALAATSKYFVLVFLEGGNDGLNTIVPASNGLGSLWDDYRAARGDQSVPSPLGVASPLFLPPGELLIPTRAFSDPNTNAQLGFHPGLAGLKALYEAGQVAVIQGCGYPSYSLSHEESRLTWQTGQPGLTASTGWFGRYLRDSTSPAYGGTDIPAVCIEGSVSPEFAQTKTNVLAIGRLAYFGFPHSYRNPFGSDPRYDALQALYDSAQVPSTLQYVAATGAATLDATQNYPGLDGYYRGRPGGPALNTSWNDAYDALNSGFGSDLREVAKVIYGSLPAPSYVPVNTHFFRVSNGGYDTHSNEGAADPNAQHYQLHKNVGDALNLFAQDCQDMGVWNDVCIMIYSEFARRIQQNDSGTDHGSQGPVFVIGGAVNPGGPTTGVYGNHANINQAAVDGNGNTPYSQAGSFRSTDFRDIYGTILTNWLGMSAAAVQAVLPLDSGSPASDYWTVPNFNMGFI